MKIIIGADIVPTVSNKELFINGNAKTLVGEDLLNELKNSDMVIANLETPLTKENKPIEKNGPCIRSDPETIAVFKELNIRLLGLANNHIMDYGEKGLYDTQKTLTNNNIDYIGVGGNIDEAVRNSYFEIKEKNTNVGVYVLAEHEFSIADNNLPGANPYNPFITFDEIKHYSDKCDYLIVLYHGGKEYYRYPSPNLQKVFRKMVDCGADLIVAQHTHCVGCEEIYHNSQLVYGQGNFIFDNDSDEYWNTGLLIKLSINKDNRGSIDSRVQYLPIEKNNGLIRFSNDESILRGFFDRTEEIKDDSFVKTQYGEFAQKKMDLYMSVIHGYNLPFRILRKIFGERIVQKLYQRTSLLSAINFIECEAHEELLREVLRERLNDINKKKYE